MDYNCNLPLLDTRKPEHRGGWRRPPRRGDPAPSAHPISWRFGAAELQKFAEENKTLYQTHKVEIKAAEKKTFLDVHWNQ